MRGGDEAEVEEEEMVDEESKEEVPLKRRGVRRAEAHPEQLARGGGDDERDARIRSLEVEL